MARAFPGSLSAARMHGNDFQLYRVRLICVCVSKEAETDASAWTYFEFLISHVFTMKDSSVCLKPITGVGIIAEFS